MTVEYLAPGIKCDLHCKYCYQNDMRDAGNFSSLTASWDKVKETLTKTGSEFTVFGGEALLTPKDHLEEVFKFGFERSGRNSVQTNLLRMDDDHIRMFKEYNVSVGVSVDGPWPMNSPRATEQETLKILDNIYKLCASKLFPSIIITIHRANMEPERLIGFVDFLITIGVHHFNFHILETDNDQVARELGLSTSENLDVYLKLYRHLQSQWGVGAQPFTDIKELLTNAKPKVNCIWGACDPLTTPAVQGVLPDGSLSNCGRTNKDGVNWVKTEGQASFERYVALYHTPQEFGGCAGCKYFYACKGQCPGTAIDNDWRNRTSHCYFWFDLIQYMHHDLIKRGVACISSEEMQELGRNIVQAKSNLRVENSHGDVPHGDEHGDHTDTDSKGVEVTWRD